nr:hypothetical protein [Candidatus Sigynarchaeota archaeon]
MMVKINDMTRRLGILNRACPLPLPSFSDRHDDVTYTVVPRLARYDGEFTFTTFIVQSWLEGNGWKPHDATFSQVPITQFETLRAMAKNAALMMLNATRNRESAELVMKTLTADVLNELDEFKEAVKRGKLQLQGES